MNERTFYLIFLGTRSHRVNYEMIEKKNVRLKHQAVPLIYRYHIFTLPIFDSFLILDFPLIVVPKTTVLHTVTITLHCPPIRQVSLSTIFAQPRFNPPLPPLLLHLLTLLLIDTKHFLPSTINTCTHIPQYRLNSNYSLGDTLIPFNYEYLILSYPNPNPYSVFKFFLTLTIPQRHFNTVDYRYHN